MDAGDRHVGKQALKIDDLRQTEAKGGKGIFVSLAMKHDIVPDSHREERRDKGREADTQRQSEVDVSVGPTYPACLCMEGF